MIMQHSWKKKNDQPCHLLLLLHVLVLFSSFVVAAAATAAAADQTPARDTVIVDTNDIPTKNCVLGQDGTCLETNDASNNNSNNNMAATTAAGTTTTTNDSDNDGMMIPPEVTNIPLPPLDEHYLMDVGYGEPQLVAGEEHVIAATKLRLQRMLHYFETVVQPNEVKFPSNIQKECQNRNAHCAFWAAIGECQVNPAYMLLTCAAACMSCEQLDFHHRCPMPDNVHEMNIWKQPGQLEDMFARIVAEYKDQMTILSRPGTFHEVTGEGAWVIQLDDFLTEQECDRLIELGTKRGYEQSKDVGERKFDGTYDSKEDGGRTSKNTWCLDECYDDPVTKGILKKIEDLTGIPDIHSEYLQLLRYEEGEFYNQHHDYIPHHIDRPSGPRILTVFLYLNTVEEGGGTYFNDLEITCQPKKGRAVIWPSVLDRAPDQKDARTHHEALPVIKGVKYGANAWIHLRDFKTPYQQGCI